MIISHNDLSYITHRHPRQKIVFCSGSFDLPHLGHIRFFEACKELGDVLVVAVGTDAEISRDKSNGRPILSERVRLQTINALRCVDEVFLNPPTTSTEPLAPIREMLLMVNPDMWVINHDASQIPFRKELADELGIELHVLDLRRDDPEWAEISTTQIIEKIWSLPDRVSKNT